MKKLLLIICAVCLLAAGCGSDEDIKKVGVIRYLNITEESLNAFYENKYKFVLFDNMTSMTAALNVGQIDEMIIYESVASYLTLRNPDFEYEYDDTIVSDVFCCAMREQDTELKEEFDNAIKKLTTNGTLTRLVKTYIHESTRLNTPSTIKFPTFYGKPTIRIAVTGDLPMLDYVRPDGVPAGFNTALLAEISSIIEKNFALVQIDSGSRAIALTSGQVDVIFWAVMPGAYSLP